LQQTDRQAEGGKAFFFFKSVLLEGC